MRMTHSDRHPLISASTGRYFWRVQATRQLVSLNPAHLDRFWLGLPPDLPRVDAVYERANDSKIVFIAGEGLKSGSFTVWGQVGS